MISSSEHHRRARFAALAVALVVSLLAMRAAAEPALSPPPIDTLATPLHVRSAFTLRSEGGSELRIDRPAYIMSENSWDALDLEVRRLQEVETRLNAENASLRKSARAVGPGWGTLTAVAAALVVGIAAGAYAF